MPVGEDARPIAVGAGDDVQIGEDDALVDDDHAGAHASLDVLVTVRCRRPGWRTRTTDGLMIS